MGKGIHNQIRDIAVQLIGDAKVAMQRIPQIAEKAHQCRIIQPFAFLELFNELRLDMLLHHYRNGIARDNA